MLKTVMSLVVLNIGLASAQESAIERIGQLPSLFLLGVMIVGSMGLAWTLARGFLRPADLALYDPKLTFQKPALLTPREEGAVLMAFLTAEASRALFRRMEPSAIHQWTLEINQVGLPTEATQHQVIEKAASALGCEPAEVRDFASRNPMRVLELLETWSAQTLPNKT